MFTDTASGAKAERPGLDEAIAYARPATRWSSGNSIASGARSRT